MSDKLNLDWNKANIGHIARHGVTAHEVEQAFANGTFELKFEVVNGEPRWTNVGRTNKGRFLTIVYTERSLRLRVVTAFDAPQSDIAVYLTERI